VEIQSVVLTFNCKRSDGRKVKSSVTITFDDNQEAWVSKENDIFEDWLADALTEAREVLISRTENER
jgi:DNA-binding SARP family transcriptional activator